jgi:hypothetical protein
MIPMPPINHLIPIAALDAESADVLRNIRALL